MKRCEIIWLKKFKAAFMWLLLVFLLSYKVFAEWQTVGSITRVVEQRENYAVAQTTSGAKIRIEFFDAETIRIRLAPSGEFENLPNFAFDSALERRPPAVKIAAIGKRGQAGRRNPGKVLTLTNSSGVKIIVDFSPLRLTILDEKGEKIFENAGLLFERQTGEVRAVNLRRSQTENYYGFGEKALPFSRDGQTVTNWNTDTYRYQPGTDPLYQSIPFFIALDRGKSYGLFFHNSFRTTFDMGKTSPDKFEFAAAGGELDFFIFTGGAQRNPKKVLADYTRLTGMMPLPPLWSLGNQQSRFSYFPEAKVREIAAEFRRRRIPADAVYIDIDYMDGFRIFTWDKEKFPNPPKLNRELANLGFKTILILNPAVKADESFEIYGEAKRRKFFVKNSDGTDFTGAVWAGKSSFLDFANPQVRDWFGGLYRKNLEEGIGGFWNDMNEPSNFPAADLKEPIGMFHPQKTLPVDALHTIDGKTTISHARFHNLYGMQMARSTFEGLKKLAPAKRPFVLSRAGFSGIQRFAAVWTGDNTANWEHLRLSLPMLLNMSVSGIPFVGADIGGYSDNPSPELFARWMQAAALTPLFRPHAEKGTIDKEPWQFGAEVEEISRRAVELRYQLLPYIYTLFREHELTGAPVMRPLWFEYPDDFRALLIEDQFLVGRDLLVAPVVREGQKKRSVYFPAGDDWRDWQSGEIYKGGTSVEIETPLAVLPVFARVGAVIPTQAVVQHTGEMTNAPLTLNVIAGIRADKTERAAVWQDAGDGYGYKINDWRQIYVEHRRGLLRITPVGNFKGQRIAFLSVLGIAQSPREITINGKPTADFRLDADRQRLQIGIGDIAQDVVLKR